MQFSSGTADSYKMGHACSHKCTFTHACMHTCTYSRTRAHIHMHACAHKSTTFTLHVHMWHASKLHESQTLCTSANVRYVYVTVETYQLFQNSIADVLPGVLLLNLSFHSHGSLGSHGPQRVGFVGNCQVDKDMVHKSRVCGQLSSRQGQRWAAALVGARAVNEDDVAFYDQFSEKELEDAECLYPPVIHCVVKYPRPPDFEHVSLETLKVILTETNWPQVTFPV